MNRVGLCNKGLERVISNIRERNKGLVLGCNIGKNSATAPEDAPQDYLRVFRNLYQYVDYFTVNVSYNTSFKQYVPRTRESIISILEPLFDFRRGQNQYRPILLKISPDLSNEDIDMMTDIMVDTPLDGIVATNGTVRHTGLTTDAETLKRYGSGAVSGKPLTKRSIEVVRRVYERSNGTYPIIGVGGVMTPADAKAMLEAGATLVQVYTGYVYNGPNFVGDICKELINR
jgi:dihydroorotate dehydrogenase